jgi:hypothetical protein
MENFFQFITKPIPKEEVEIWFNVNNMIPEKGELFFDFCYSLYTLMQQTYLGDEDSPSETKIQMEDDDKKKHFLWCWNKTIDNFKKENLFFQENGDHFEYFETFFLEVFYHQKSDDVKNSIKKFIIELFDKDKTFTRSDLDLYTEIYKLLDKHLNT